MDMLDVFRFQQQGTKEHVLLLADMVELTDGATGVRVTEQLASLFGHPCPSLDVVLPLLVMLVDAEAAAKCGFLAGGDARLATLTQLQGVGLQEDASFSLITMIMHGCEMSRAELLIAATRRY